MDCLIVTDKMKLRIESFKMNIWDLDKRVINHKIADRVQLYTFKLINKVWFHLTYIIESYDLFTKIWQVGCVIILLNFFMYSSCGSGIY
jgi:hypothetical protein